jgi:myo-inositol-1(or 4)-monophosphatase
MNWAGNLGLRGGQGREDFTHYGEHMIDEDRAIAQRYLALQGMGLEASALAMRYFRDQASLGISMKGAQDWLTKADGEVEMLLRARIAEAFPDDGVLGEEGGYRESQSGGLWVIDPIDGTANFARNDRVWSVSIGFVWNGRPELGLIAAPALDETYLGRRGHGASLNGARIAARKTADIKLATIEVGWSPRMPIADYTGIIARGIAAGANVKRGAAGALGLAYVAYGRCDGYIEQHTNSWDVAAGLVIAKEAGAYVSDFARGDWLLGGNSLLCCTPALKDVLIDIAG